MVDDERLKEINRVLDGTECVKCPMTNSPMTQGMTCKACLMGIIRELVSEAELSKKPPETRGAVCSVDGQPCNCTDDYRCIDCPNPKPTEKPREDK